MLCFDVVGEVIRRALAPAPHSPLFPRHNRKIDTVAVIAKIPIAPYQPFPTAQSYVGPIAKIALHRKKMKKIIARIIATEMIRLTQYPYVSGNPCRCPLTMTGNSIRCTKKLFRSARWQCRPLTATK